MANENFVEVTRLDFMVLSLSRLEKAKCIKVVSLLFIHNDMRLSVWVHTARQHPTQDTSELERLS